MFDHQEPRPLQLLAWLHPFDRPQLSIFVLSADRWSGCILWRWFPFRSLTLDARQLYSSVNIIRNLRDVLHTLLGSSTSSFPSFRIIATATRIPVGLLPALLYAAAFDENDVPSDSPPLPACFSHGGNPQQQWKVWIFLYFLCFAEISTLPDPAVFPVLPSLVQNVLVCTGIFLFHPLLDQGLASHLLPSHVLEVGNLPVIPHHRRTA
jgi:hypothetical protein